MGHNLSMEEEEDLESPYSDGLIECTHCFNTLTPTDLLTFDNNCPNCFEPIDMEDLSFHVSEDDEFTIDHDDILETQFLTVCCGMEKDECGCDERFKGPIFEDALHEWIQDLPENIYMVNHPSPCLKCAFQWIGKCKPLVESLMILNLKAKDQAEGSIDDDLYYVGQIDGCIDYTILTDEDTYVKQVQITRRRAKSED